MKIAVIDGQGGGIGKSIIERIKKSDLSNYEIVALGTNSSATAGMIKAGAKFGATGENAIKVNASLCDVIMGPIAIMIPNAIMGEITQTMALSVTESKAVKILIPLNRCRVEIPGTSQFNINELLDFALEELIKLDEASK